MTRLALLLILALSAQVQAQSGKLLGGGRPRTGTIEGYEPGHCVAFRNRIRVCKVLSESDALFLIEKDGKLLGTWPAISFLGETDDFEVLRGDLDGNGKLELIIANRDATGVGMAVSTWSIAIFQESKLPGFQPPVIFSVKEYGSLGTFVSAGGRLNILTTDWVSGTDPKGKRGEGLYLVGQWWRYQGGELAPLPRRSVARRYLLSFERERWATIKSNRIPYQWLSNRHTESISTDFITGSSNSSSRGVIESVSPKDEKSPYRIVKIVLKPDEGPAVEFIYPNEDDEGPAISTYIGDIASGRIYPDHYLPSDPKMWLTGRRVTLRRYDNGRAEILWLDPRRGTK